MLKPETIKVLVADDSKTMRDTLAGMLKDFAYEVAQAVDGQDAIDKYREFRPDIILLDLNMPKLDGVRVIEFIRRRLDDQDVLIIMVTSERSQEIKLQAFNAGANDFLNKPFDRAELLARVAVAAKQVRLNNRLRKAFRTIEQEIDLVAELQGKLLPSSSPDIEGVQIHSLYKPSGKASGDYFDHFPIQEGVLRAIVADVSGHGARAAFIMSIVRTLFRTTLTHYLDLEETFDLLNNHLCHIICKEDDFVTILAADIDFQERKLTYINAGHCPGMLKTFDGELMTLSPTASVVGFFEMDYPPRTVELPERADLFLFTDGFYDWEVSPGEFLDFDGFWEVSESLLGDSDNFLEDLMDEMQKLSKIPCRFRDDVSALWMRMEFVREFFFKAKALPDVTRTLAREAMSVLARSIKSESDLYDLDLALTEACANVVDHAYKGDEVGDLEIKLHVDSHHFIVVEVADWGVGFDGVPAEIKKPDPKAESGRGIYIISKLMDEFGIKKQQGKNIVFFRKNIKKELWKVCL